MEAFCYNYSGWIDSSFDSANSSALPNLSECAQFTAMVWIPAFFFLIMSPVFAAQIWRIRERKTFKPLPFSSLLLTKFVITGILFLDAMLLFLKYFDDGNELMLPSVVYFTYPLIRAVTMAAAFYCLRVASRYGVVSSGILFNTWLLHTICAGPELYGWYLMLTSPSSNSKTGPVSIFRFITSLVWFIGVAAQTLLFAFADKRSEEEEMKYSAELNSSFLNRIFLWWFNALPMRGAKQDLTIDDLFELNRGNRSEHVVPLWEHVWNPTIEAYNEKKQELLAEKATSKLLSQSAKNGVCKETTKRKAKNNGKGKLASPSIVYHLFKLFKWEFFAAGAIKMVADVLQFVNPFLLKKLIDFVTDENAKLWQGVSYALLMFCASELRSLMVNYYFFLMFRVGVKLQTVLTAAVYKKSLRLSSASKRERTAGEIINLMAIDIEAFQNISSQIHQLWSSPFQIIIALIYLFNTLGISALPGVVVMVIFVPLSVFSSYFTRGWQMQQMKLKDQRSKMISEILNGIKVIKLYAWEIPMMETIDAIRKKELTCILKAGLLGGVIDTFNICAPFLVAICSFAAFTLLDPANNLLTPQVAFVSLTLFNQTLSPMIMMGYTITMFIQFLVSNKRLREFLVAEEITENIIDRKQKSGGSLDVISVRDADFSWGSMPEANKTETNATEPSSATLATVANIQDLNLNVARGTLMAVVGKVGAGKSSLLSAMLGEMEKLRGYVGIFGKVAYVPQSAWIRNMSFRENITFGRAYDRKFYKAVIDACALQADLDTLPQGDATEIGEKGINLSGGQKARVSLARAVYQNCDIYLLDDPLSAVDSHVGKHIFEQVIGPKGMLKNKTRILVTHGIGILKEVDKIILLEGGQIVERGTYSDLVAGKGKFCQFIEEDKNESSATLDSVSSLEEKTENRKFEAVIPDDDEIEEHVHIAVPRMSIGECDTQGLLERQLSIVSTQSNSKLSKKVTTENGTHEKNLIEKEKVETGRVNKSVYFDYIKSAGIFLSSLFLVLYCCFQVLAVGRSVWLSKWVDDNDVHTDNESHTEPMSLAIRLQVYTLFGIGEAITYYFSVLVTLFAGLAASRNLHNPMLIRILRAPMSFFDTTPLGRILNRFTNDVALVDSMLTISFRYFVQCAIGILSTLTIIVITTPVFVVAIVPLAVIYYLSLKFYVPTARQLKRLESVNRSPIYSHFGETIQGASSIRAFGKTNEFCAEIENRVDRFLRVRNLSLVANRWIAIRLEFVGNAIVLFAALFAALSNEWGLLQSAGLVGLSVSYALSITDSLNFVVRLLSGLETTIVSVERIKEFSEVETEAEWNIKGKEPPKGWPNSGALVFENYSTRYRPGLELVVKNINAEISPAENVGIVGRTGAGKSSLTLALFRMLEPAEGRITIDGVDISEIGLHDLRSNLTVIPQDPVLFSGTLRFNLDPFSKHSDVEIWKVLELAHLKAFVGSLAELLDHPISEGGENISLGQRQLVCLARALLRRTKILVLDEATAAVDVYTDSLIQETIRKEFRESTVFTIAHRLNTIIDYNRVIVLQQGQIMEFDSPQKLLSTDSLFSKMAQDAKLRGRE
ncbi:ABC transporter transmembrane region domain-containing protein [Ditylenchus destructor]|uniref:ABC transporter transmembrane region domain-containing protein n=1 Tax=Ditylenchus destructor TaxID=166010 RepID=A0AAD4MUC2_9BILA|nr:ABC transporter transmembrane region domain-containing protein [Ditylenchus destructor]